ncbi:kelch-like protein 31-like protein [Corchorus olitorius]|uniref:Kelch-like protein 31-like protein n=1 Tax=Corchorus olitorius TaxID=93759 RepID=A0A1R3FV71_9ROSI|nr:kelch-like protein 31-like protein [Corchorus olitorius]
MEKLNVNVQWHCSSTCGGHVLLGGGKSSSGGGSSIGNIGGDVTIFEEKRYIP